jgi:hypothetical protein
MVGRSHAELLLVMPHCRLEIAGKLGRRGRPHRQRQSFQVAPWSCSLRDMQHLWLRRGYR